MPRWHCTAQRDVVTSKSPTPRAPFRHRCVLHIEDLENRPQMKKGVNDTRLLVHFWKATHVNQQKLSELRKTHKRIADTWASPSVLQCNGEIRRAIARKQSEKKINWRWRCDRWSRTMRCSESSKSKQRPWLASRISQKTKSSFTVCVTRSHPFASLDTLRHVIRRVCVLTGQRFELQLKVRSETLAEVVEAALRHRSAACSLQSR